MKINFGNRVSAQSWARVESTIPRHIHSGRRLETADELEIDLSAVGFADFITLGRILLLVDDFVASGLKVHLYLPSTAPLRRESSLLSAADTTSDAGAALASRLAMRLRQRLACRQFLRNAGFEPCLEDGPWERNHVCVSEKPMAEDLPADPLPVIDEDLHETIQPPSRHRRLLPYRWMAAEIQADDAVSETSSIVDALTTIGLPYDDAELLSYGLISELIENTRIHCQHSNGRMPLPLFGAALIDPFGYGRRVDDFDLHLRSFISEAAQVQTQMVRIFVGDSGKGIYAPNSSIASRSGFGEESRANLEAILNALSRRKQARSRELAARGLWKVQRIVEEYGGTVIVRSGYAQAGYIYRDRGSQQLIREVTRAFQAGTAVECNVRTTQQRDRQARVGELASPIAPVSTVKHPRLHCVSTLLKPGCAIDESEMDGLRAAARRAQMDGYGLAVAMEVSHIDGTLSDDDLAKAMQDVANVLQKEGRPPLVALALAGANRSILALVVEALNLSCDEHRNFGNGAFLQPILVVAEGVHFWLGGDRETRTVLGKLSEDPTAAVPGSERHDAAPKEAETASALREAATLLEFAGSSMKLTLRPHDVLQVLVRYCRQTIAAGAANGSCDGVRIGEFLTPNLRQTSRWLNVRRLLTSSRCLSTSSLALAHLVAERLSQRQPGSAFPSLSTRRAGSMTRDMTRAFQASLDGVLQEYRAATDSEEFSAEPIAPVSKSRAVVISTDLISTEHSVRAAVDDVLSDGDLPIAIAAFVDVRKTRTNNLDAAGLTIPVIRLASISIELESEHANAELLTAIDPVLGEPLTRPPVRSLTMEVQQPYIDAIVATEAARLGHITRPAGRHYSAYVDPTMLYTDSGWRKTAMSALMRRITVERNDAGLSSADGVCILYPSRTRDNISVVVDNLQQALSDAGITVTDVVQVPRAAASGGWRYPVSIDLPSDARHIILIDSGSRTGRNARELIRLASIQSARLVTAIVLANGMDEADAVALQQMRAVEEPTNPRRAARHNISIEVNFLTRTAVAAIPAETCSICELRRSYASIDQSLPHLLSAHREYLLNTLEPKTKDDAYGAGSVGLFGDSVEQRDCVSYLHWRAALRDSRFSTFGRLDLASQIKDLHKKVCDDELDEQDVRRRDSLIRVLAAEASWLHAAPLSFVGVRDAVVGIAEAMLLASPASAADPMLRVQAAAVLSAASPWRFGSQIGNLVRKSIDHHLVVAHVLIEAIKLINDTHARRPIIESIAQNLTVIEDLKPTTPDGLRVTTSDVSEDVRFVASLARTKLPAAPSSRQVAWSGLLKYSAATREHRYDQPIWRLQVSLDNLRGGMAVEDSAETLEDWLSCSEGLAEILPHLSMMSAFFLNTRVTGHFSYWDSTRWEEIVSGGGSRLISDMTARLTRIFSRPAAVVSTDDQLMEVMADIEWWNRFFFSPGVTKDGSKRDAILPGIVRRCPAPVNEVIEQVYEKANLRIERENLTDDSATLVFCTRGLLADVLGHVKMNAEFAHRIGGSMQKFLINMAKVNDDQIQVEIFNTGSAARRDRGGRGLSLYAADLAAFGATLEALDAQSPWTYGIRIVLPLWKGM